MKDDNNIFDDDDALDCILYQEMDKPGQANQNKPGKAGCLGALPLLIIPAIGVGYTILNIT